MNKYSVYGLNIKSEIVIEEFDKLDTLIEDNIVNITYGEMPENIKEKIKNNKRIELSKNETWFHINNIATYRICNGNEVTVELAENPDMQIMRVYIMCSCLGFIMLQRDMVAIHGGVIEMDNKAVIFTGDRGAGKSTLITALREKGYKFISDDVAGIKFNNAPYVMPGFPYQKLCTSAMDKFGYDKESYTSFMSDKEVKYIVPAKEQFVEESRELISIIKLTVGDVEEVTIEELKGYEKLNNVIENIYRGEYIPRLGGMSPNYFKKCLDITKYIKFYKVTRPKEGFIVNKQIELIEGNILILEEAVV